MGSRNVRKHNKFPQIHVEVTRPFALQMTCYNPYPHIRKVSHLCITETVTKLDPLRRLTPFTTCKLWNSESFLIYVNSH
jgi:hypothetical protein